DPMFKNTKVAYSLYENCFEESLSKNLKTVALTPEMDPNDTTLLKDTTCSALHMNAINYSDVIIKADENIDSSVLKFLSKQNDKMVTERFEHENVDFDQFVQLYEEINLEMISA